MTEQNKKELIEMGFEKVFSEKCLRYSIRNEEIFHIDVLEWGGGICLKTPEKRFLIGYFESVGQIRRKIEGLKMLIS